MCRCRSPAGHPGMLVVGLPDKDVNESRTQVRAAMASLSLDVPPGWLI